MGQRSQIYIRYNNSETLVARHLQWNWGEYMIARANQLLEFISKNIKVNYSNFLSEHFEISNHGEYREDLKILDSLTSLNTNIGSYVGNVDLIEEKLIYNCNDKSFKFDPERQDNNDGILVIDIKENEDGQTEIKYGFSTWKRDGFKMCSALKYINEYKENLDYRLELCKTEEDKQKVEKDWNTYIEKAKDIDKRYGLLSQKEYEDIFDKEYLFEKCLEPKNYVNAKAKRIEFMKRDCKYDEIISLAMEDTITGNYYIDLENEYGLDKCEIEKFKELLNQDERVSDVEWSDDGSKVDIIFYLENCPNAEHIEEEYL